MDVKTRKTFISLTIFMLLPFIIDIVKMRLLIITLNMGGFSIAGHIEWFDLINETLQAFLIIPLYRIFAIHRRDIKNKFSFIVISSFTIYVIFQLVVYLYINKITLFMNANGNDIIKYLRLENLAFAVGFMVSILIVYLTANNEYKIIWIQSILKIICYIIIFLIFIPRYNVFGIAYGNILINFVFALFLIIICIKRELISKIEINMILIKEWMRLGIFTGGEILLNNIIYSLIVCRMVNAVSMQGTYWAINNVIWGFFLIPFLAMNDIIKTEVEFDIRKVFKYWKEVLIITYVVWIFAFILAKNIIYYFTGMFDDISIRLFRMLLIYYLVYGFTALFDGFFVAKGRTQYLFYISLIVNIIYYGIVYILFFNGLFVANLDFIVHMFGVGMVIHLILNVIFVKLFFKK